MITDRSYITENVDSDVKHKHSNKRKKIICLNEKKR